MFWEIKILFLLSTDQQKLWKSKDREKPIFLCKYQQTSFEICCCIMSDLEIHVVSTPLHGINSVEVSVCGGPQPFKKLIVDVCSSPGASKARVVLPGSMQKDEDSLKMEDALAEEEEEEGIDCGIVDEESSAFADEPASVISTSPGSPVRMGSSPPIKIPRLSPIGSGRGVCTPTHSTPSSSSFYSRSSPDDEVSPLSSGYGSAPRFFAASVCASTQTPPLSPVLHETQIRLHLIPNTSCSRDSPSSAEENARRHTESRRTRYFSLGSAEAAHVANDADDGDNPLPDVVGFRDRANSAPARPVAPEIMTGRELRRIGDDFVARRSFRRRDPQRRSLIRRFLDNFATPMETPSAAEHTPTSVPSNNDSSV
ncbi:uncharacterized protein [Diadema antillarum]|uniref:uncharacterized protein n=1 Tax=Diadema antillarum TaxID=105358 RepID=UPI003A835903